MSESEFGHWKPLSLSQVRTLMADAPMRWWVTGGHALELHFGQSWRQHGDTDISVLRHDVLQLRSMLDGWRIHVAAAGALVAWTGEPLAAERSQNNLWCARSTSEPWGLDVVISDGDNESWIYRRNPSIRSAWTTAVLTSPNGMPYLAPELQLLFKGHNHRPKDDVDAATTIPLLDSLRRDWLADRLDTTHPWQAFFD